MRDFLFWLMVANSLAMIVNFALYGWGSHLPSSLAVGALNGFVMLYLQGVLNATKPKSATEGAK